MSSEKSRKKPITLPPPPSRTRKSEAITDASRIVDDVRSGTPTQPDPALLQTTANNSLVQLNAKITSEDRKYLRRLATDLELTIPDLVTEAIELLKEKYGQS